MAAQYRFVYHCAYPDSVFAQPLAPQHSFRREFFTVPGLKAASKVSTEPGSSNLREVGRNAKEEVKNVTKDIAKAISGANSPTSVAQQGSGNTLGELESQVEGLTGLAQTVPRQAWAFGGAGFLPYIATSASTVYLARQVWLAEKAGANSAMDYDTALALLHHVEMIQVSYGAVILSFLGALHWGFEFSAYGGRKGTPRYLLGIAPIMLGWPSLLLPGQLALITQWGAYTAVWYLDSRATANGWTPKWYSTYRFGLTAVAGSCILITVGATGYYSSDSNTTAAQKLAAVKGGPKTNSTETETAAAPRVEGSVDGDISTQSGSDAYVVFQNETAKKEEEDKKKKEEAEAKEKEAKEEAKQKKEEAEKKAREARDKAEGRA